MNPPVIICALGGSGTRVVARIVRAAGFFMGTNRNESEDAMEFVEFYDRWINRYILRERVPFCREEEELMSSDFLASVARHRLEIPADDVPWGWKEPRSHFVLPFFHAKYPKMKLIHLVRDGRDMAFSANQNQLRKHGAAVLDPTLDGAPQAVRSAAFWAEVNLNAAVYAERNLGDGYLLVRFEDLCQRPGDIATIIAEFLNVATIDGDSVINMVKAPASIGRWRRGEDSQLLRAVQAKADAALQKFGYAD